MIQNIKKLRKALHRHPEVSGSEKATAEQIRNFINTHHPTQILDELGGHSLAAIYEYGATGKTIVIRCELDALPIAEENSFAHASTIPGVSHKCGHDGHMAIVAGLVFWIKTQTFSKGKIVLLFQAAEETGKGACSVLQDPRFTDLRPDFVFALHNIPGASLHSILLMENGFSSEVLSCSIALKGQESHAAAPENGINPGLALAEIIQALDSLNHLEPEATHYQVLTPVHMIMGQKSYGISPANGELHYTIRTRSGERMEALKAVLQDIFQKVCTRHRLLFEVKWFEHFPASANNLLANRQVAKAADDNGFQLIHRPHPFAFGEDFGWFSKQYKTAMFGLGAGLQTPALHNASYDFPDALLETGMSMFQTLIKNTLEQ